MEDKFKGALYGLAIGDALGTPHELRYQKKDNYTGYLEIVPEFKTRFQGTKKLVPGQYSDDTLMTLSMLHALKKPEFLSAVILNYLKFANLTFQLGSNTRQLFKGITTEKGFWARHKKRFPDDKSKESAKSNGALMRCSMLAFIPNNKDKIIEDCKLTNPNNLCISCNLFYTSMITYVINEHNKENIMKFAHQYNSDTADTADLQIILKESMQKEISENMINQIQGPIKGYVLNPIFCMFWAFNHFNNYQDSIDAIIKLGGDCDTNAAISGAFLGTYYGYASMNNEEKTKFNIEVINDLDTEKSDVKLPKEYLLINNIDEFIFKNDSF